ncbi:hypothetical protein [Sphingomonas paeninsulae]|uniref:hypothetical protein n=1 Tax=Sphingomonas paeninsulae TaxID=2319844 RepID=UPI0013CEDAF9|nr:hypothetical protein [Sphingomonas paeninsulae]
MAAIQQICPSTLCLGEKKVLITVYHGADVDTAKFKGTMYFDAIPARGEELEIDNRNYVVGRVWHLPNVFYAGAKLAILINETAEDIAASPKRTLASA